jgi:hypothetical protein
MTPVSGSCANCAEPLAGEYCSRCGQKAIDYHRPFSDLFSDVVGDIFNLDTRLVRTLRPLMLTPGALAKDYIAGPLREHTARVLLIPAALRGVPRAALPQAGLSGRSPGVFALLPRLRLHHAFVFVLFSLFFLAARAGPYLPSPGRVAIGVTLGAWLFAYLPIALRRVYGGSRVMTGLKLATLGVLYVLALVAVVPVIVGIALLQF